MRNKKRAQMAIFVIIALFIVLALVLLLTLKKNPIIVTSNDVNMKSSVEKCARDAINEAAEKMLSQGGFITPLNYKKYNNINIEYLCENIGYYSQCVNQHPMLINEEINEIKNYIEPIVEQCFESSKNELEKRLYNVSMQSSNLTIEFAPGKIILRIDKKINIQKAEQSQIFDGFRVETINPLYDLSNVAVEIANQEAKYCYFEYVGYMILYPQFSIEKIALSDSTKIYTIEDVQSKKKMNIAIRSCVMAPGP